MRFILGIIVGAGLLVAAAWMHDTGQVKFGPAKPFVNWDTVIGLLPR
jgi:hypothetical protein